MELQKHKLLSAMPLITPWAASISNWQITNIIKKKKIAQEEKKAAHLARQISPLGSAWTLKWMVTKCTEYSTSVRVQSFWHY